MKKQDNWGVGGSIFLTIVFAGMAIFSYQSDPSGYPIAFIPGIGVLVGIVMTIKAAKQKYPDKKIVAVFQPHTFSRTLEFTDELANVLNNADATYVLNIFPAREKQEDYPNVKSQNIVDKLNNGSIITDETWDLLKEYKENTVVLFMSPKEIHNIMNSYKEYLKEL